MPTFVESTVPIPPKSTFVSAGYDLNGDGHKDVVTLADHTLSIFLQQSDGRVMPTPSEAYQLPGGYPYFSLARLAVGSPVRPILIGPAGVYQITQSDQGAVATPVVRGGVDCTSSSVCLFVDVACDLDKDGCDEIVLPESDQLSVFGLDDARQNFILKASLPMPVKATLRQQSVLADNVAGGKIFEAAAADAPAYLSIWGARYPRVLFAGTQSGYGPVLLRDWNADGLLDILSPDVVYEQKAGLSFTPIKPQGGLTIFGASGDAKESELPNLADFNHDGRLDRYRLVAAASRLTPRADLEVFLARPDRSFSSRPDVILRTRDLSATEVPPLGDIDGDGYPDVGMAHLDLQASSATGQFQAYLKEGLSGDIRFYCWDGPRNRIQEAPIATVPVQVNYEAFGSRQLFRPQFDFHLDFNGDKQPDLVTKLSATRIGIHLNLGGRRGFTKEPVASFSTGTASIAGLEALSMNADGLGDIVATCNEPGSDDRQSLCLIVARPANSP